mmetsp:Transcript_5198/g.11453  ORF Transcript_5198/g.11453 Transcript_5198/m.11453 type:complete len:351 (+) Transcript_5198:133-1185(+)
MRAEALVSLAGAEAALLAAGSRVQGLMLKIQQGEEAMARVEPLERALAAISEECRELREQQQQQRVPIASPDTRRLEEMVMELRGTLRDRDRELSEARQRVSRLTEDVERVAPLERELLRERARVAAQVATSARHAREMQSELRRIASRSESGRVEELGHILSDQRQRIMTLEQRVLQLQPGLAPYHPHHAADTFPRSSSSPQRTPSPPIARVDFTNPFNYPFRSEHPDAVVNLITLTDHKHTHTGGEGHTCTPHAHARFTTGTDHTERDAQHCVTKKTQGHGRRRAEDTKRRRESNGAENKTTWTITLETRDPITNKERCSQAQTMTHLDCPRDRLRGGWCISGASTSH